jgi:hypothetical protein
MTTDEGAIPKSLFCHSHSLWLNRNKDVGNTESHVLDVVSLQNVLKNKATAKKI